MFTGVTVYCSAFKDPVWTSILKRGLTSCLSSPVKTVRTRRRLSFRLTPWRLSHTTKDDDVSFIGFLNSSYLTDDTLGLSLYNWSKLYHNKNYYTIHRFIQIILRIFDPDNEELCCLFQDSSFSSFTMD